MCVKMNAKNIMINLMLIISPTITSSKGKIKPNKTMFRSKISTQLLYMRIGRKIVNGQFNSHPNLTISTFALPNKGSMLTPKI